MRSGSLRHRVDLMRATRTRDGVGDFTTDWASIGKRWASITPLTAGETTDAGQTEHVTTHQIELRYDSLTETLTSADRIVFDSRVFEIDGILNTDERNTNLVITARETRP